MRLLTSLGLLALTLLLTAPVQAQTTLRWKFAKDQAFDVVCTQQTEVETSVNNKPRRAYLEMTMQLAWNVDEVDEAGVATISQTIKRLQLKTTAPDADPIVYDSESLSKPSGTTRQIAAGLAPLVGTTFTVKMDARGDVTAVTLTEAAQKSLAALPEDSQLKQVLTVEGITNLFRTGDGQLPEQAVSPGDTWPLERETTTPLGTLRETGTFAFAGQESIAGQKVEKIELASTAKLDAKSDAAVRLRVQEQTKSSVLLFDAAAGRALSSETKLLSKSVRPFRDRQIHVTINGTTKLTFTAK